MRVLKIFNPIFLKDNYARIGISDYNLNKLIDLEGNLKVIVYDKDRIAGQGIINNRQWIKTAKHKEAVVKLRPNEPMEFFYNNLIFSKPLTDEEKLRNFCRENY